MTTVNFNEENGRFEDNQSIATGTFKEPYENLIFLAVDHHGNSFSFLNKLGTRHDFRWDKWSPWRKQLRPYTFHCFRVEGYKTNTASGSGFRPLEHIAEFPGIDVARLFNKTYCDAWQTFQDTSDVNAITQETDEFIDKMKTFSAGTFSQFIDVLGDEIQIALENRISKESYEFAMSIKELPVPAFDIDGPSEWYVEGFSGEEGFID